MKYNEINNINDIAKQRALLQKSLIKQEQKIIYDYEYAKTYTATKFSLPNIAVSIGKQILSWKLRRTSPTTYFKLGVSLIKKILGK